MLGRKPRQIAARVLGRRNDGVWVEDVLEEALADSQLIDADRRLCHELVCGVVRRQATLDWLIDQKTHGRPPRPRVRDLLRLGLYQLFWLDRVPPHAAVNETVEVARRTGLVQQAGFVNALLRGYARESDATRQMLLDLKQRDPALGFSHPAWLVARWVQRWGLEKTLALMNWNNAPPAMFARVNTLKTDAGALIEAWRHEKVQFEPFEREWTGSGLVFELKSHPPLREMQSFKQGWFYVQDPSTLLAPRLLDPQPGETVFDLCAAPGGKLAFMAQLMCGEGPLVAQETAPARRRTILENCERMGVTFLQGWRLSRAEWDTMSFDRVLVDVPCSNTGVMRRRVELRWRLRPDDIEELRTTQLALLSQAAAALKPGGRLVYSTCSLEPEENEQVVERFLETQPRFKLDKAVELLPFKDGVDGAYVAVLRREV